MVLTSRIRRILWRPLPSETLANLITPATRPSLTSLNLIFSAASELLIKWLGLSWQTCLNRSAQLKTLKTWNSKKNAICLQVLTIKVTSIIFAREKNSAQLLSRKRSGQWIVSSMQTTLLWSLLVKNPILIFHLFRNLCHVKHLRWSWWEWTSWSYWFSCYTSCSWLISSRRRVENSTGTLSRLLILLFKSRTCQIRHTGRLSSNWELSSKTK